MHANPWPPYTPTKEAPWDLRRVVHLHRRAGFAASWVAIQRDLKASVDLQRYLPGARIGEVHGKLRRSGGRFVFPMYHPAAALHQASLRETLFRDIRGLPAALLAAREAIETERMAADTVVVGSAPEAGSGAMVAPLTGVKSTPPDDEQMTLF